jgi:glutaredoxin 3
MSRLGTTISMLFFLDFLILIEGFSQFMIREKKHLTALPLSSFDDAFISLKSEMNEKYRIFEKSRQNGDSFKQTVAYILAGDYDKEEVMSQVTKLINDNPCIMFSWERSPSCKSAIEALDNTKFRYAVVRLDNPWDEGNKIRAEIGKMVGRTSVPMIFIGGNYVGGYDGGIGENAPGLVSLAFQNRLYAMLEASRAERIED